MWELIFKIVLCFLALSGLVFIVTMAYVAISDWLDDRKLKRAFGDAKTRDAAIKETKLKLLRDIHIYCHQCLAVCCKVGTDNNSAYMVGTRDGVNYIEKYVEERYRHIKEDEE